MIDSRSLAWRYLMAPTTQYEVIGAPDWVRRDLASDQSKGEQVSALVLWGTESIGDAWSERFDAVTLVGARGAGTGSTFLSQYPVRHRFAVVPNIQDARWLIPLTTPQLAAASLSQYKPLRKLAHIKQLGATLAATCGLGWWYRHELVIARRRLGPVETLARDLLGGEQPHLVVATGTPGPERKPAFIVMDAFGRARAVFKLADNAVTRSLVQCEADTLIALEKRGIYAPKLLAQDNIGPWRITAQSVLAGSAASACFSPAHRRFLRRLACGPSRPAAKSALVVTLRDRLISSELRIANRAAVDIVDAALAGLHTPSTVVHGDFAPWNLRYQHGELHAFDWEYSIADGLPLIDEIHYRLHTGILLEGWSDDRAFDELWHYSTSGDSPYSVQHRLGLLLVYLLHVGHRRSELGHPPDETLIMLYRLLIERIAERMRQTST